MPLGHAQTQVTHFGDPSPSPLVDPISGSTENETVRIYGASDDLIEVEGNAKGCDEYSSVDSHFMLIGDSKQVRIRCWYTKSGVWAVAASQAAEGMDVLPVHISSGEGSHSVVAAIEGVRLVIHEHQGA